MWFIKFFLLTLLVSPTAFSPSNQISEYLEVSQSEEGSGGIEESAEEEVA